MNTKTPIRRTKVSTLRVAAKPTPATAAARKQPTATSASAKTRKPASVRRVKVTPRSPSDSPLARPTSTGKSKQARLISLLQAKAGATIDQMITLTGWQAHTVRGTISGVLRKKLGLNVICTPSVDTGACLYRIVGAAVRA